MQTNTKPINVLFFIYSFFSFAVMIPDKPMNSSDWITQIFLLCAIYLIYGVVLSTDRKFKPLTNLILLIYIISLISVQIIKMQSYMKIYHGQTSAVSTIIVSAFTVITLVLIKEHRIEKLYVPLFAAVVVLAVTVFALNIHKINIYNLNYNREKMNIKLPVTLFDCIIPYIIALKNTEYKTKKTIIPTVLCTFSVLLTVVLYSFMSVKGNLLYSLSPLQMIFRVSSTKLIRNFDALFNYLLYLSFFGALVLLIVAYSSIKEDFPYFNNMDLLLTIPFYVLLSVVKIPYLLVEFIIVIIMVLGRERKAYYEKSRY